MRILIGYMIILLKGGKVHRIRSSVIHLMRGQVFLIEGKKIFTFGGANSHDISGGILEPDDPNYNNLEANGNDVDFIVSHCCSSSTQALFGGGLFIPDVLTDYLEQIRQTVTYKKWFFGHYHDNKNVNAEEILLYDQVIRIS